MQKSDKNIYISLLEFGTNQGIEGVSFKEAFQHLEVENHISPDDLKTIEDIANAKDSFVNEFLNNLGDEKRAKCERICKTVKTLMERSFNYKIDRKESIFSIVRKLYNSKFFLQPDSYFRLIDHYELVEDGFRQSKDDDLVTMMPIRHWTDSKIRCHIFTCVAALTLLRIIEIRLRRAGLHITAKSAMKQMHHLHSCLT